MEQGHVVDIDMTEETGRQADGVGGRGARRNTSRSPPEAPESEKGSGLGFGNDTDEPPVAPRAHKKSKRGCRTCKQRKIKCDENHPLCDNCRVYYQNKVAECDYGTPPTSTPQSSTGSSRHANQRKKRKGKDLKLETSQAKLEPLQDSLPTTTEVINLPFLIPGTLPQSPIFTPISAEMMDPFHTHPSTPEPEADELLRHYFQSTVYQIFPFYPTPSINPQAEFYSPLIYTDPLLYHVTLQLSAFHLEKLRGSRTKPQSKRLMTECLRLLRERVESATGCGTSDETIAGVAGLASIEHERGNVRMLRLHLHGLTQILLHRGGLHALRTTSPMIANLVFCIFAAANEEPFPASDLLTPFPTPDWYLSSLSSVSEPQGISFEDHGVAPAYATVLRNVRLLAKDFQQASDCDSSEMYLSVLSFLCANVQRIMSLPPVSRVRSRAYCVAECVRAALIVHVFHLWCGRFTPDPELLVNNARQNLKSALKPLVVEGVGVDELVLWFACVGATGSRGGSAERRWFIGHVVGMVGEMGIGGFEGLRGCLRRVVWHELQDGPLHRVLWEEMVELM